MITTRRIIFGILLAGLLFFTGILLRDFLLVNLVKPMALMLWIGNRLIASIDQVVYWAGLILTILFLSLLRLAKQPPIYEVNGTENRNSTLDSIRHWRTLILLTTNESDRLNFLKNSMQKLLKDIYASKQPSQVPWKIYQDIDQGDIKLPVSIREFLMLGPSTNGHQTRLQRLQRLSMAPLSWVRKGPKQNSAEYYQSIAEVISFMEKELEKEDDE